MLIYLFIMFLTLIIFQEISRRSNLLSVILFLVLPIVMVPYWFLNGDHDWFYWAKSYASLIAVNLMLICRLNVVEMNDFVRGVTLSLMIVHVGLMVISSLMMESGLGALNALNGLMLIVFIPDGRKIKLSPLGRGSDFLWDIPYSWIIGYSLWSLTFVYISYPENVGRSIALMLASLVVAIYRRELWLQARLFSMAVYLQMLLTSKAFSEAIYTDNWYDERVAWIVVAASLLWASVFGMHKIVLQMRSH